MDLLRSLSKKKNDAFTIRDGKHSPYHRRGDVRKAELELRKKAQEELDAKREGRAKYGNGRESKEVEREGTPPVAGVVSSDNEAVAEPIQAAVSGRAAEAVEKVEQEELTRRLRRMGEPICLFGESVSMRQARLRLLEDREEHNDDFTLGHGHNVKNTFLERTEEAEGGDASRNKKSEESDSDHEVEGGSVSGASTGRKRSRASATGAADEDNMEAHKLIRHFFKALLRRWEMDLNSRPEAVRNSTQGRMETKSQKQTKDYMRPLFKACKQKALDPGIKANLVKMIKFIKEGEFVRAHDVYLQTAIGNAAWPIGITMVGIHERSGREKINSSKVAHIMNNEAQRKYLVSIKKLMTYEQDQRDDVLPSKKVR